MKEDVAGSQYLPCYSLFDIPSSIAINRHVQTIQYTKAGYLQTFIHAYGQGLIIVQ